ncbi:MAG TPA: N-acetyltransferase [Symbiobacteriaceae bacterium]|nr:N-acetyltransferase [Symbiobacteriaceae bacterium]
MQLQTADKFSLAELTRFWNLGYTGYFIAIEFTEAMLSGWIKNGDFDLSRSIVAMDGENCMGFSLLGVRGHRGWIGGFGVAPDYRGRGLAYELFSRHVDLIVRETDLKTVQLEVLVENWARKVYERAGFAVTRRLSLLQGVPAAPATGTAVKTAPPVPLLAHHYRLHAGCKAVWQREISWIEKTLPPTADGFYTGTFEAPTGFLITAPAGEGLRIVDGAALTAGDAEALVAMVAARYPGKTLTAVNEPEGGPLHQALVAAGLPEVRAQWELVWTRP